MMKRFLQCSMLAALLTLTSTMANAVIVELIFSGIAKADFQPPFGVNNPAEFRLSMTYDADPEQLPFIKQGEVVENKLAASDIYAYSAEKIISTSFRFGTEIWTQSDFYPITLNYVFRDFF
jgi:hypothetical protein